MIINASSGARARGFEPMYAEIAQVESIDVSPGTRDLVCVAEAADYEDIVLAS